MRGRTGAVLGAALGVVLAAVVPVAVAARAGQPPVPAASAVPAPAFTTCLVDVGGRRVAFHVAPGRPPAVVFESGGGMDGSAWNPVAGLIQRRTGAELVTFDRAGFGDSDEDVRPVRIENEVSDLEAGLSALGITRNLVLVAHSYGGEVATSFADRDPGRIARAVLVDASIPSFFTDEEIARIRATLPKDVSTTSKQERTQAALMKVYPAMLHRFHSMRWPASIPTTVIVSEHPPLATAAENGLWIAEHRRFARAAPDRSFILARNSGHLVMNDRPDVVADAVVAAVEQVRRAQRP